MQDGTASPENDAETWLRMAEAWRSERRLPEAAAAFDEALALRPGLVAAHLGAFRTALGLDDIAAAERHLQAVLAEHPHRLDLRLELAAAHLRQGRAEPALTAYRAVLAVRPDEAAALQGAARAAQLAGQPEAAVALLIEAASRQPAAPEIALALGELLLDQDEAAAAEIALEAVLDMAAGHAQARLLLARLAHRQGNAATAAEQALAAVAAAAGDVAQLLPLARTLRNMALATPQEAAWRAILAVQPGHGRALIGLAEGLRQRGENAQALALFRRAAASAEFRAEALLAQAALLRREDPAEAEAACRQLLAEQPGHPAALLHLGRLLHERDGPLAALPVLQQAARLAPAGRPGARIALAAALRDSGDFPAARSELEAVLATQPDDEDAWAQLSLLERRADRPAAALAALERLAALAPGKPGPQLAMAQVLRALGQPAASEAALRRAIDLGAGIEGQLQLAEHLRLADDQAGAKAILLQACEAADAPSGSFLSAATMLVEQGEPEAGFALLDRLEARQGRSPAAAAHRAALLRRLGDISGARAVCEAALLEWPRHFQLWAESVRLALACHDGAVAGARLASPPAVTTTHEQSRILQLQGEAAALDWRLEEARDVWSKAAALRPDDVGLLQALARVNMQLLDLAAARHWLGERVRRNTSQLLLRGRSLNVSRSFDGQLLDEFCLDQQQAKLLRPLLDLPAAARVPALMAAVRQAPDHTPTAMLLMIALRQARQLDAPTAPTAAVGAIPRQIAQFWDRAPPADIAALMQGWRRQHPGWVYTAFDEAGAAAYLAEHFPADHGLAFHRMPQPAGKADLLRLAWLWREGGCYVDADDRCLQPLDALLPPDASLVLYQEEIGTVGNNLIAATARHPVIGLALAAAVTAVNRGDRDILWLSTGPGLLTRSLAQSLAQGAQPIAGMRIHERRDTRGHIAMHCLTGYKYAGGHWNHGSFVAGRRPR